MVYHIEDSQLLREKSFSFKAGKEQISTLRFERKIFEDMKYLGVQIDDKLTFKGPHAGNKERNDSEATSIY